MGGGEAERDTQRIMNVNMAWKIMIIMDEDKDYTGGGGGDYDDDDDDDDDLSLKPQRGRS